MRRIKVKLKRRREGKTNYRARARLLRAEIPRLVVRKTNRYIIAQIVQSKEAQDFVICGANSAELKKFGWSGSFKNMAAAYLTGALIAKKAKQKKIEAAIPDFGLHPSTKGSRLFALLKGAAENSLAVKFKAEFTPSEQRITNKVSSELLKECLEKIKK